MKKILMCLALVFSFNSAYSAEGKNWKGYYENLLKGLKSKVQKKFESKNRVSAVAAVRGSKQGSDAEAPYWKGGVSEKAAKKIAEEKMILTNAVQFIVDGDVTQGRAALEKFVKDNPDSLYVPDANEALANLPKEEAKSDEVKTSETAPAAEVKKADEVKPSEPKPAESKPAETSGGEKVN